MNAKALVFALSAVTLTATADNIYTVSADTTAEISLAAAGCATDRIQFAGKDSYVLKHRVTDATGTIENPFTYVGDRGGYVWATAGLHGLSICLNLTDPSKMILLRSETGAAVTMKTWGIGNSR